MKETCFVGHMVSVLPVLSSTAVEQNQPLTLHNQVRVTEFNRTFFLKAGSGPWAKFADLCFGEKNANASYELAEPWSFCASGILLIKWEEFLILF